MADTLSEGMRRYDLEDLVLPLISIDEFESKVDDTAIVFGFYVSDQNAAKDLNRFLQKSAVEILDTDISPAPDQHGYFMVFVEMANDDMTARSLLDICDDIKNLTGNEKWRMRIRGRRLEPLDAKPIIRHLARERRINRPGVLEYLAPSSLHGAQLVEDELRLNGQPFEFVDFADIDYLLARYDLGDSGLAIDDWSRWQCKKVSRMLGEDWHVDLIGNYQMLSRQGCNSAILLKQM